MEITSLAEHMQTKCFTYSSDIFLQVIPTTPVLHQDKNNIAPVLQRTLCVLDRILYIGMSRLQTIYSKQNGHVTEEKKNKEENGGRYGTINSLLKLLWKLTFFEIDNHSFSLKLLNRFLRKNRK